MSTDPKDFIPFVVAIVVAVGALFLVAQGNRGDADELYNFGLALFLGGVLFGLWSIKRFFDRAERNRPRRLH